MTIKTQVTAEELVEAIQRRISAGQYAPGERLPSVREMAAALGSNRNTVNKAYQALVELGVVKASESGRRGGYFVCRRSTPQTGANEDLHAYFLRQSVDLVWRAMAGGLSQAEMVRHLNEAISEVYGRAELRLLFLECNSYDAEEMAGALSQALGYRIEHCVLDNFLLGVPLSCRPYDLLITTYHHLGDVMDAVQRTGGNPQNVIGIDTRPSAETMLQIAHLRDRRIGLVATLQNTAHMLKHLIFSYHPEWEITAVTQDQREAICSLASSIDHLIVTHTCAADVEHLTGRAADVVVNFAVDEHSIQRVKARIQEAQQARLSEVAMLLSPEARGI